MLFSRRLSYKFISMLLRLQKKTLLPYVIAGVAIAAATASRFLLGERLLASSPFITYYPAGVIAELIGFWPGVLATGISAAAALYFFIPPTFAWSLDRREALSLQLFIFNFGVIVTVVTLLKLAVEEILEQEQSQHRLLEREKMLHQKLRHRTRNFLAMIIAIINRTLIAGRSVAEAKQVLIGRVHALAEANAMLAEAVWSFAGMPALMKNAAMTARSPSHSRTCAGVRTASRSLATMLKKFASPSPSTVAAVRPWGTSPLPKESRANTCSRAREKMLTPSFARGASHYSRLSVELSGSFLLGWMKAVFSRRRMTYAVERSVKRFLTFFRLHFVSHIDEARVALFVTDFQLKFWFSSRLGANGGNFRHTALFQ
jgi:hypothetical protein